MDVCSILDAQLDKLECPWTVIAPLKIHSEHIYLNFISRILSFYVNSIHYFVENYTIVFFTLFSLGTIDIETYNR